MSFQPLVTVGIVAFSLMAVFQSVSYTHLNKPEGQVLCGFSMETKDLLENSAKKLGGKNADMIIANDLNVEGAGFAVTTNVATIITKDGAEPLELMTKGELSDIVLSRALDLYNQKHNG